MKRLMTLMVGLAFLTTTVAISFAQDTGKSTSKSEGKKGGKRGKKKTSTTPRP